MNVVAWRERDGEVDRVIERLVRRAAGSGERKREALCLRAAIRTGLERLIEHGRARRNPIEAEGSVANLIEKIQIFDRRVVDAVGCTDAGLAGASENLRPQAICEAG